jgi:hypothetical protein
MTFTTTNSSGTATQTVADSSATVIPINLATKPTTTVEPSSAFAAFVLAAMRVAALRAQLVAIEIAVAGVALKSDLIDAETALAMLNETGLLPLIEASS